MMKAKALQICGTGSGVGKSVIVAALCRIFRQDGYEVCPFKAQNMALNSYVTRTGGEIGRAQAVQAEAAKVEPTVDMNPILIKPSSDRKAQIILRGKPVKDMSVYDYVDYKKKAVKIIWQSYRKLAMKYKIVVIEGAGSPAEINLRAQDIVNMSMAKRADAPVILVGDIDKGGVFAWLVGTLELLTPEERARVKGFIINKFRGDKRLLRSGLTFLEKRTGIKVLGVIPYFRNIHIPEEDAVPLERYAIQQRHRSNGKGHAQTLDIAIVSLPHISNFTDFDPLEKEPDVKLRYVSSSKDIGTPDILILPGTKSTAADLNYLKRTGMADEIVKLAKDKNSAHIMGICGGYQMLGLEIVDDYAMESREKKLKGLGILPVVTAFKKDKILSQVTATEVATGLPVTGYVIHHGRTRHLQKCETMFKLNDRTKKMDGVRIENGRICATYLHGIFESNVFRREFLNKVRRSKGWRPVDLCSNLDSSKEFDKLAKLIRDNVDVPYVYKLLGAEK